MIELSHLTIGYKQKAADKIIASDISATVSSGQLTCLIGANGAGKSTLLRTLSAFQPKLHGSILINGKEIEQYSTAELSRTLSVVLTTKPDVRNMTATELVGIGRSPYTGFWGTLHKKDHEIVSYALQTVGISHLANRYIQTLSDGERQKVMIAKSLAQQTPIILLDEPTAFLDFPSKVEMMQLLHRLSRESNKTIFLSTHDLELALQTADILWLMNPQEGLTIGSPSQLAQSGHLGRYIERQPGIHFDPENLIIRIEA